MITPCRWQLWPVFYSTKITLSFKKGIMESNSNTSLQKETLKMKPFLLREIDGSYVELIETSVTLKEPEQIHRTKCRQRLNI